jgi:hypothetical protein
MLLPPSQPTPSGFGSSLRVKPETVTCELQEAVLPLMSVTVTVTGTFWPTWVALMVLGERLML